MGLVLLPCGLVKISMWSSQPTQFLRGYKGLILNTFLTCEYTKPSLVLRHKTQQLYPMITCYTPSIQTYGKKSRYKIDQ